MNKTHPKNDDYLIKQNHSKPPFKKSKKKKRSRSKKQSTKKSRKSRTPFK